MKRRLLIAVALAGVLAGLAALAGSLTGSGNAQAAYPVPHPAVSDFQFIKATTPTEADCEAVGRTCFTPQAIQSAYNVGPLYQQGWNGKGMTIAIVDSYGSDTMAHDLHVFDQAFDLQPMCGEEGVTCTPGMPKFSELAINGSPATKPQPGNGTHQEDKSAWALEVALDVETSHAIAPMANILLVHSNNAETLGVQGFPNMMKAEDYVVSNHLAQVISQSFASAEDAFGSTSSLENLRYAFKNAAANGVTVLGSSGDGGTANAKKSPVSQGGRSSRSRRSNGRPRIRSSPASAARTCAPTRPRPQTSRGRRPRSPAESGPSAAARARSTRRWLLRSPGRSRAAASATCSRARAIRPARFRPAARQSRRPHVGCRTSRSRPAPAPGRSSTCRSRLTARRAT